ETVTSHGCIEPDKDSIREEPYSLPQLQLGHAGPGQPRCGKALRPPGWLPQWHCGVRVNSNQKLVGFISAIPATIRIYDREKRMVEINFLCVHKKLRSKRVAPVLIREITRRVNLQGIFQAVYTAGVVLPKPVGTCRYWHRSLNPRKLIEVKFSHLSRNMTMQRTMKLYRLPEVSERINGERRRRLAQPRAPKTSGLRPMTKKDVPVVHQLLGEYLRQFNLVPAMNQEEVEHWLLPRENIIDTYLVEVNVQKKKTIGGPQIVPLTSRCILVKSVRWRLPERWKGDRFPEFLHSALHHYEPPCAPQPKSSVFLLQRAHGHAAARPDARRAHPGKI
ncbi:unnamed protein product, partial [Tetraodon nigroviridis]